MDRRAKSASLVSGSLVLLGWAGGDATAVAHERHRGQPPIEQSAPASGVRVMTQNMYVGLDVFPIIAAPLDQIPFVVADGFADFVANRPEDRMAAIASEIAVVRPHLVGLQEVVELFEQFPSDAILGELTPNATDPVIDFLSVLLDELDERGLHYEVAAQQAGTDLEFPRFDGLVDGQPAFTDVRSRFSDVILRRADVDTTLLFAINYATTLPIPSLPGLEVPRNAVGVLASVRGNTFRFVSTHLEPLVPGLPDDGQPQLGQVLELIELLSTAHEPTLPTVVVGDFNSVADVGTSYQLMAGAGFTDVWTVRAPLGQTGLTCCQDVVLTNPRSNLSERIDFVWTANARLSSPVLAFTVGDQPIFRTRTRPRLWPSDHAGLTALLRFGPL
jgi:endonuclease/exonuclease/phosphatase family metal-dependent hydrolase